MKYLFLLLCMVAGVIEHFIPLGFTATSPAWSHLTYNFAHANVFHLIINMVVFVKLYDIVEWKILLLGVLIATVISFVPFLAHGYTVGFSGVLFAMLGFMYVVRKFTLKSYLINAAWIVVGSVVGLWAQNVNVWLHIACLTAGIIAGVLYVIVVLSIWGLIEL